jgi:hypothetical protein
MKSKPMPPKTSKELAMPKGKVPAMNHEKKGVGHSGMMGKGKTKK